MKSVNHVPKTILVTGGKGLVGSAVTGDIKLSSDDGDLRIPSTVNHLFKFHKPTHIIHCAGRVGGVLGNINRKGEFFYDNIMINTNVIECARRYGVKRLVSFLSTCIFPDDMRYPLTEDSIHNGPPHSSNNAYAYAKRMSEVQIRAYKEQYDLDYLCVIPTNVFGPCDNFNLSTGHVLPSLIHKCYIAKKCNTDFNIWGTGQPLREFIYSKDLGKITDWLLQNYTQCDSVIISPSQEISIKDVVDIIVRQMSFTGKVSWDNTKPDGQYRKPSNNTKLKQLLPGFKFTPIQEAIGETIEWFNTNYPKIRK